MVNCNVKDCVLSFGCYDVAFSCFLFNLDLRSVKGPPNLSFHYISATKMTYDLFYICRQLKNHCRKVSHSSNLLQSTYFKNKSKKIEREFLQK